MRYYLLFVLLFSTVGDLFSEEAAPVRVMMEQANEAYSNNSYREAIDGYETLLSKGYRSEALYFNLGNSYYRVGDLGRAVLNYERARLIDPNDRDINHNLSVVRTELRDDLEALPPFFLLQWWRGLRDLLSSTAWSILAILLVWIGVGGLFLWRSGKTRTQRKWGFIAGIGLLLLSFLPFLLAAGRQLNMINSGRAVILSEEVTLRSAPDPLSKSILELHEGITVELLDLISDWHKVRLPNGEEGWLPNESFEKI